MFAAILNNRFGHTYFKYTQKSKTVGSNVRNAQYLSNTRLALQREANA